MHWLAFLVSLLSNSCVPGPPFVFLGFVLWHMPFRYSLRDGSGEVIILNSPLPENRFILILYLCLVLPTRSLMSSSDSCSSWVGSSFWKFLGVVIFGDLKHCQDMSRFESFFFSPTWHWGILFRFETCVLFQLWEIFSCYRLLFTLLMTYYVGSTTLPQVLWCFSPQEVGSMFSFPLLESGGFVIASISGVWQRWHTMTSNAGP